MLRPLLCALAVAGACTAPNKPAKIAAADAPAGTPTDPPKRTTPELPRAPVPAPVLGEPYYRPGDRAQQLDALTFWGWSRDGRYFAFETHFAGPGAATCEGEVDLFVVDADIDIFTKDGHLEIRPTNPDKEPCDPPDLQAAMDVIRPGLLKKYGIDPGHLRAPILPKFVGAGPANVKRYTLELPSGKTASATLEVLHGDRDTAHEGKGSAFKLSVAVGDDPPLLVEPGQFRRPYVWDYDLGPLFLSPDGSHAALMVHTTRLSFEGDRASTMANAIVIPAGW